MVLKPCAVRWKQRREHGAGLDFRKRIDSAGGPLTITAEFALGQDEQDWAFIDFAKIDWLLPSRRWGAALQHVHYWKSTSIDDPGLEDAAVTVLLTYYLRNDIGNANLHWLALALEQTTLNTTREEKKGLIFLQYYRYW